MEKNKYQIVFFDIDGTLASNEVYGDFITRIPTSAIKTIKAIKENGIIPAIATGRSKKSIKSLLTKLEIDTYIASNGLHVFLEGKEIKKDFLSTEQIEEILSKIIGKFDANISFETSIGNILIQKSKSIAYEKGKYVADISENITEAFKYDIFQVNIDDYKNIKAQELIISGLKARIVAENAIDLFPEECSKAAGATLIADKLQINSEAIIAFGDEENDIEIFDFVGTSVAMGNANNKIKEMASHITDTVENDGIYMACLHYELI